MPEMTREQKLELTVKAAIKLRKCLFLHHPLVVNFWVSKENVEAYDKQIELLKKEENDNRSNPT